MHARPARRAAPAHTTAMARGRFVAPIDGLLLLMSLIWAANFSVVKLALREIPPLGFNSLRLLLASSLFLGPLLASRRGPRLGGDWIRIAVLGLFGHFVYQICFMIGLARTTVANSSLILGCTPIAVTLLTAAARQDERVGALHWAGAALSAAGIYLVVGRGAVLSGGALVGDLLMFGAVWCWAIYTVAARPLLTRHSPLVVTGYSMACGTALYVPLGIPDLVRLDWRGVSTGAWVGLVASAVLALCVAYLIWYTAVQRIGGARTAVYSNTVPVIAMIVAAIWLGEPVGWAKIAGAAAIISGVGLTKIGRPLRLSPPAEE